MSGIRYEAKPPFADSNITIEEMLHLLRNPWGYPEADLRASRLAAADIIDAGVANGWIPVTLARAREA